MKREYIVLNNSRNYLITVYSLYLDKRLLNGKNYPKKSTHNIQLCAIKDMIVKIYYAFYEHF